MTIKQRAFLVLALIALSIAFLAPTLFRGSITGQWISKPISLGLDLSGGVHLVYEVDSPEAVKTRLQTQANTIRSTLREAKIAVTRARVNDKRQVELTLLKDETAERAKVKIQEDFRTLHFVEKVPDGDRVKLVFDITEQQATQIENEAIVQAVETLRNRIDQFGVTEPLIQRTGANRITLQMPGLKDPEGVKKVVGSVAKLEFRLMPNGPGGDTIKVKDRSGAVVAVEEPALMSGDAVDKVSVDAMQGQVEVLLGLTTEGGRLFRKITTENVGRQLAIVLDGVLYSSPVIREAIGGGQATISGGFTFEEARQLAVVLRSGALPAPLKIMEERTVGPTLGQESIRKGVMAIAMGFAGIVLFMCIYYKKSGFVALASLGLNLFFLLALLSAFGATLTLPGLAGLALTVGMAVDSNVIIFERIRDEIRNGVSRDAAVAGGFDKAFSAIWDANLSTFLVALILYYFGNGPIRGFAVTLAVGIITTVFCAITVARLIFDAFELRSASANQQLSI